VYKNSTVLKKIAHVIKFFVSVMMKRSEVELFIGIYQWIVKRY